MIQSITGLIPFRRMKTLKYYQMILFDSIIKALNTSHKSIYEMNSNSHYDAFKLAFHYPHIDGRFYYFIGNTNISAVHTVCKKFIFYLFISLLILVIFHIFHKNGI